MIPFRISRFLFFPYVYADTALARTSEDNAIPTAIYGSIPRNVISIGLMTAAALIPAKPVPSPAPIPAKKLQQDFVEQILSGVDEEKRKKMAEILNQMEKNLDEMLKGEH